MESVCIPPPANITDFDTHINTGLASQDDAKNGIQLCCFDIEKQCKLRQKARKCIFIKDR
jgi:hypothetical protein